LPRPGRSGLADAHILAADTVVAVGRRILPKAEQIDEASNALYLLSGRNHRVFTGICLVTPDHTIRQKIVETRVRFKRLSPPRSKAISPRANGAARPVATPFRAWPAAFVVKLVGSYTNVVGLPLYETVALLTGEGYDVHYKWLEG
jgi:septum formation protein